MTQSGLLSIPDLKVNEPVRAKLLLTDRQLATTREGRPYLKLTLMNRTGSIEGILWENAEAEALKFSPGEVAEVQGTVVLYQQERRLRVQVLSPVPKEEVRREDYLPASARDPSEMEAELHRTIRKVRNPFLRRLLESVFRDPEIWEAYRQAPAAKAMHHAYLGGLLEHTLSLARLVQLAVRNYPFLDADLVLAGALLHDLGKAWELSPDLGFEYTDSGRLVGHIVLGLEVLDKKIREIPDFPSELAMHLKHIVASHHGELAHGSPKRPKTLEALCLHGLDNLDAKLWGVQQFMQRETKGADRWTPYHRVHERYFYVPERLMEAEKTHAGKEAGGDPEDEPPDLFGP